jgi:hypothetical protein
MVARMKPTYRKQPGPNTGKRSSTYQYTTPDGATHTVRSFKVSDETAVAWCYYAEPIGRWFAFLRPSSDTVGPALTPGDTPYIKREARRVEAKASA